MSDMLNVNHSDLLGVGNNLASHSEFFDSYHRSNYRKIEDSLGGLPKNSQEVLANRLNNFRETSNNFMANLATHIHNLRITIKQYQEQDNS